MFPLVLLFSRQILTTWRDAKCREGSNIESNKTIKLHVTSPSSHIHTPLLCSKPTISSSYAICARPNRKMAPSANPWQLCRLPVAIINQTGKKAYSIAQKTTGLSLFMNVRFIRHEVLMLQQLIEHWDTV